MHQYIHTDGGDHHRQVRRGISKPVVADPRMLLQEEEAGLFLKVSLMSCSLIPRHGLLVLQSNVTASAVADAPFMFLYVTPLIFIPELCMYFIKFKCVYVQ